MFAEYTPFSEHQECTLDRFSELKILLSCTGLSVFADVIIQTAPSNAAATQSAVQNLLTSTPEPVKELPEKLLIAVSLTIIAAVGYLLRDKLQKDN